MAIDIWIGTTNAWATAGNWSTGSAPVNSDTTYLQNNSQDIAASDQSAVTLARFVHDMSYTGKIAALDTYLQIGATTFDLGQTSVAGGSGSARLNLQCSNSGAIVNVYNSATTATDSGYTPVRLKGTSLVLNCTGGTTGVSMKPSETASVTTLTMLQGATAPSVYLGVGCTTTTANVFGGFLYDYSTNTMTTLNVRNGGQATHYGTGAITTATVGPRSKLFYNGSGTITTLNLTGTLDMSDGDTAVTVTNCNLYAGASIIDPANRITFTNPATLVQCRVSDVSIDKGFGRTIQFA